MSAPYRSRMGQAALADGPAELQPAACPDCRGHGLVPAGKFAPRNERECDRCDGTGEIDADQLGDEVTS